MRTPRSVLVALAIMLAMVLVDWLRKRGLEDRETPLPVSDHSIVPSPDVVVPLGPPAAELPLQVSRSVGSGTPPPRSRKPAPLGQASPTNPLSDSEQQIDAILESEAEDSEKLKKLLDLFPTLPAAIQEEAAQHLCNLTPDEELPRLGPLLSNPRLAEPVLETLVADLLSRPNPLKLPLLLTIARTPQHPTAEEARSILELYLEKDYGADWDLWEKSLALWLQQNPD